jgi:hypothetical protein
VQKHLLIAGTGRAGTSFLVKYLTELGLDTQLARHGAEAYWDENAQAGLENMPLLGDTTTLPYVVKSPYAYQFIDKLLERDDVQIDGVILPIRDLIEAASSRSLIEMQHLNRVVPWLPELDETWEQWALTPGGVVYSLNALDQARLLAVGFHHLVERLVKADIRISFIHFPEMITDADYLFRQLACFLPDAVTIDSAREAHARIADRNNVHVGDELKTAAQSNRTEEQSIALAPTVKYPSLADNDAIAQRRENRRLRDEVRRLADSVRQSETGLSNQVSQGNSDLGRLSEELSRRSDQVRTAETELAAIRQTMDEGQRQIAELEAQVALAQQQLSLIRRSTSWRMTMPLRALGTAMRSKRSRQGTN